MYHLNKLAFRYQVLILLITYGHFVCLWLFSVKTLHLWSILAFSIYIVDRLDKPL